MKEFEGKLQTISAGKLIDKDKLKDFDSFFLVLGLIYNDMRDLVMLLNLFNTTYRQPKLDGTEDASVHLGNWGGVQNHFNRLMIGFISEFLIFLKNNEKVTQTLPFMVFEKKLPQEIRDEWFDILSVVKKEKKDTFLSEIAQIRSNVTFHYDHSLTELRSGFVKKFFNSPKDKYNKKAFYALGDSMETTRFFYCDGAVDEYLKTHMKASLKNNYFNEIKSLVEKTNRTIRIMMEVYIKDKQ